MLSLNPLTWFEKKDYSLSDSSLAAMFGQAPTLSGVAIGPESALTVPVVNAAVRVISESVASLPVNVLRDDGTSKTVNKDHPIYRIIHSEPNAWTSKYEFVLQGQVDCLLQGNAYAFVNRLGGVVRELIRIPPGSVSVKMGDNGPVYTVRDSSGRSRDYASSEIIHIKALSTNGLTGIAPIQHCREAIALALALEGHAAKLMGNSARPSGILRFKGAKLNQQQLERIKEQWRSSHNAGASGGTAVFDSETEFQQLTFSSVDIEFSAMRTFQLDEISRAFRVPPHLLSNLGRATWSNTAEMNQSFLDTTLVGWLLNWQGALARALFTPEERQNLSIEFDTSALTRANLAVRTESYFKAVGGPVMTANEARALENRPPIEGGDLLNKPINLPTAANDNVEPTKDLAA
ncbi:phage portal protein [Tardiphaga sp. vice352]|uniref:phage portal protein n=1 Tax=Tardiphaga sp. vice352 TaxID=2592816 RepID=UPI0011657BFB|nr:phage portal protein [Tardiphaga sp. vice352]QDM32249.1 phage portal protein [Tardiphaga sp. vice352]